MSFSIFSNLIHLNLSGYQEAGKLQMKHIPTQINALYDKHLCNKGIPKKQYFYYKKWLRYYLDFCSKYTNDKAKRQNFDLFIKN
jgi:hypothetical protein